MKDTFKSAIHRHRCSRTAVSTMEVLVSATLLVALIGVMGPAASNLNKLHQHTRHHLFATNELLNKINEILSMPERERLDALDALDNAEDAILARLEDAKWRSQVTQQDDYTQCRLTLEWKSRFQVQSVSLTFWPKLASDLSANLPSKPEDVAP